MDASQYKGYVLFLLFIEYVSDKYADSGDFAPLAVIPHGASFEDRVALKGKLGIGDKINTQIGLHAQPCRARRQPGRRSRRTAVPFRHRKLKNQRPGLPVMRSKPRHRQGVGIGPHNAKATAYDTCCGSGSLLLKLAAEAGKHMTLEGHEKNMTIAGLVRMNMILHDLPAAKVLVGSSTLPTHRPYPQTAVLRAAFRR